MKKHLSTIFLVVLLLAGVSLLLYPTVSDYWNTLHATAAVTSYAQAVRELDNEKYEQMLQQAQEYNRGLLKRENPFLLGPEEREAYPSLLDLDGTGIMGYIEIPAIDVSLPIYHGTEDSVLQIAVGHLEWTSLPVGGESTHCVLSGHRGLPSAKLFTNLDRLTVGDTFVIRTLDEVLTYEVSQILIVEPAETEALTPRYYKVGVCEYVSGGKRPPRRPDPDDDYSGVRNPAPVVASANADGSTSGCPNCARKEKPSK